MKLKKLLILSIITLLLCFSYHHLYSFPQSFISGSVVNAGDYASIQKAVDALGESGGTVFIPAGTYKISEPINVTKSDVTLMGAGSATILLNVNEEGENTFELIGAPKKEIWHVSVCNMHLKGTEKCGNGIHAYCVNEISLREMWIDYHGKSGIFLDYCYENPRVCNNNIAYNKEKGLLIDGCHDVVVSANEIEENGTTGTGGAGVFVKDGFNATISGNDIDDNIGNNIHFVKEHGSIITGNVLENSIGINLFLEGCSGTVVTGNTLRQPGDMRIVNNRGVTITGNSFDMTNDNSIEAENSNLITISGNIFMGDSKALKDRTHGIIMRNVNNVSISGNTMEKPIKGGIYIVGNENKYINITGNTIKNPSEKSPGEFSGILIQNTQHSIVSYNIIIDDGNQKIMKSAVEETGSSDFNIITNNRVNKGTKGDITIIGKNTKKEGNFIY
jgi:parallel beta-helix repeat protein